MNQVFETRLEKERKRVYLRALAVNSLMLYYFFCGGLFLWETYYYQNAETSLAWLYFTFLPAALVVGLAWTRSQWSAGRLVIERTNSVLKNFKNSYQGTWILSPSGIFSVAVLVLTVWLGWEITEASWYALFSREGMLGAQRIFVSILNPNWAIIGLVLSAMVETIFIALMATALAIPVAFVASFVCARNLTKGHPAAFAAYNFFRFIFNFTRSVEPIIWAIIFSVWVGIGPFAGMLALMLHSVSSLAKLYSEQIENINRGPIEAMEATGANPLQVIWYGVVPQIVLPYLSFTIYRWDINVRMATIIGLVGGGGVGTLLMQYQGLAKWNEVGTIVIVIAAVVWVMDYLSAKIREAIY